MSDLTRYPGVKLEQHQFVLSYLLDYHVPSAARRCGISIQKANNFLVLEPVKKMIRAKARDVEQVADVTVAQVINELKRIAFFDHKSYLDDFTDGGATLKKLEQMDTKAIQSMNVKFNKNGDPSVEIKPYNKVEALKELLVHLKGHQGPSSLHLHITEEKAKEMSAQEIASNYQLIIE